MKNVAITCVGKLKEKFYADAFAEYRKRLGRFCSLHVTELPDFADDAAVRRESDGILSSFRSGEYRVLCDIKGELLGSEDLAKRMDEAYANGHGCVRFIVGGSQGVDERVRSAANLRLSFGRLTYPHQLMRVLLAEQVYRAFTISSGLPYHK